LKDQASKITNPKRQDEVGQRTHQDSCVLFEELVSKISVEGHSNLLESKDGQLLISTTFPILELSQGNSIGSKDQLPFISELGLSSTCFWGLP
jgi:hypothetical protein